MQNCNDPSGLFDNSIGTPQGNEDGRMVPASSSSSSFFLIINYS